MRRSESTWSWLALTVAAVIWNLNLPVGVDAQGRSGTSSVPIPPECAGIAPTPDLCGGAADAPGATCNEETGVCCREWCVEWDTPQHPRWGSTCAPSYDRLAARIERARSDVAEQDRFFGSDWLTEYYASHGEPCCSGCCGAPGGRDPTEQSDAPTTIAQADVEAIAQGWVPAAAPAMLGAEALAHGTSLLYREGRNPFSGIGATTGAYAQALADGARRARCIESFMTAWTSMVPGLAYSGGPGNYVVPAWLAAAVRSTPRRVPTAPLPGVATLQSDGAGRTVPVRRVSQRGDGGLIFGQHGPLSGGSTTVAGPLPIAFVCRDAAGQIRVGTVALQTNADGSTRIVGRGCAGAEEVADATTTCPPGLEVVSDADGLLNCACPRGRRWDATSRLCLADSCAGGSVWDAVEQTCRCPEGDVWRASTSSCGVRPCTGDQTWLAATETCACPSTRPVWLSERGTCSACAGNSVYDPARNQCLCPAGTPFWNASSRVCEGCSGDQVLSGGRCVCPADRPVTSGSACAACPTGTSWSGTSCECPGRQPMVEGRCPTCDGGRTWAGSSCVCPAGTPVWAGGRCSACPSGQRFEPRSGACAPASSASCADLGMAHAFCYLRHERPVSPEDAQAAMLQGTCGEDEIEACVEADGGELWLWGYGRPHIISAPLGVCCRSEDGVELVVGVATCGGGGYSFLFRDDTRRRQAIEALRPYSARGGRPLRVDWCE